MCSLSFALRLMPYKYIQFFAFTSENIKVFTILKVTWTYRSNKQHSTGKKSKPERLSTAFSYSCVNLTKLFMDVVNIFQGISFPDFSLTIYLVCTHFFCNENTPHILLQHVITVSFKN